MSVLIDTGPLVAYCNDRDPDHERAVELLDPILQGEHGIPLSTDYVLDEGLTFLRKRWGRERLSRAFAHLFLGPWGEGGRPFELLHTSHDDLERATEFHLSHYDQNLSTTDCTLIVHARRNDAAVATFDAGFQGLLALLTP